MHRVVLLTALATAVLVPAVARAAPPTRPNAPPPEVTTVQIDRDGNLEWTQTTVVYRQEERLRKAVVGGKEVAYTEVVTVPTSVKVVIRSRLKGVKAFDLNGLPIDADKLPKLLGKSASVILSPDGQPIDGFYRQFFKEETLMLVLPSRSGATVPVDPTVPVPVPVPPRGAP